MTQEQIEGNKIIEFGFLKGEMCNRNGCEGIINEYESEDSCSCHINPPCSYCTDSREYCPECRWEGKEEQHKGYGNASPKDIAYYKKEQDAWANARNLFYQKYNGKTPIDKLEIRCEPHTHFSQKQIGIFPKGTETRSSVLPQIVGTFGGRFTFFGEYSFEYIAYTD